MASAATGGASATNSLSQAPGNRNAVRQTRTNPSRVSKTAARSFPYYGQPSASDSSQTANVPHGLYPALTHFTDAITALPREFRRHNSLLKEVDAKAWALEDNLHQLLLTASDSRPVPFPANPAPIVDGVVRDYGLPQNDPQNAESQESKHRRQLFDRIRRTLSDLMLTADEKNHVLTNANEVLDHQLYRLNSIYPYISTEVSEEARLGSLTHWAYSNRAAAKAAAKTTTNERPRREAASATSHLVQALQEADAAAHRSEARREAVRKQRRGHVESDFDETRTATHRKGGAAKSRAAGGDSADSGAAAVKRRKIAEKPVSIQAGSAVMERSASTMTNGGRTASKDGAGTEVKKRARAPNAVSNAGRKRNNTMTSAVDSHSATSPPVVGTFNPPRSAPSPGPRPQSSRAQQPATQSNSRQRPPSSSSRVNSSSTFPGPGDMPLGITSNPTSVADKPMDSKANVSTEDPNKEKTPQAFPGDARPLDSKKDNSDTKSSLSVVDKDDRPEVKPIATTNLTEQMSPALSTIAPTKGRSSKTSTPVVSTFAESQTRARSSRNNSDAAPKRSHKKTGSVSTAYKAKIAVREEEDSSREGDDEDDESEPRYCYCNQVSFGEMVACDNDACPTEWFHLSCVGLTKPPGRNVKWFCTECKENMKRGRISAR